MKSIMIDGVEWTQERVKTNMQNSDKALIKGLLLVYSNQTSSEQAHGDTHLLNSVGFNSADATFLSSIALWVQTNQKLSDRQIFRTRTKMLKYSKQIWNHIVKLHGQKDEQPTEA